MELSPFIAICGWAGNDFDVDIHVTTTDFTKQVMNTFKIPVVINTLIADINVQEYNALAILDGFEEYCFYEEAYSKSFLDLIRKFNTAQKSITSICVDALPIEKGGVLRGRCATTYHLSNGYRQKELAELGVQIVNEPLVCDNNITISYCPQTAANIGFWLIGD